MARMSRARLLLILGTAFGIVVSVIRGLFDAYGYLQTAQDIFNNRGAIVRFLAAIILSVWFGPALSVACLIAVLWVSRNNRGLARATTAAVTTVELFYTSNDPNCYQPGGFVERIVSGSNVLSDETIYRLGVRTQTALQRCRVILAESEPTPHDPGMHRIGLPMRPRIPMTTGSEEFAVNPNAPAYVDVLQEISPQSNPMHEAALIRLIYVNEDRGRANSFEQNNYVLTFRLEGPTITPVALKLAVEFDGRRQHRRWRVRAV